MVEESEVDEVRVLNGSGLRTVKDDRSESCPYLDTINRHLLDFDFEKLCCVSLSHLNVYACLICGKYFQGRNRNSHAYLHSVEFGHHVWINLETLKFYCLPENYEIIDSALNDIRNVINPIYDIKTIRNINVNAKMCRAIDGTLYYPGIVGMNNIRETDYVNVVLHSLLFVSPIRSFFLQEKNYTCSKVPPGDSLFPLATRFGELTRKVWNSSNFKVHVSPHEMIQTIITVSKKKFTMEKQSDPIQFMAWFLNTLHLALNRDKKTKISIINRSFKGKLKVFSKRVPVTEDEREKRILSQKSEYQVIESTQQFFYLTLDVPPPPLFTDAIESNIIPQIPLHELLCKYNGIHEKEYKSYKDFIVKRFIITRLPKYMIIHLCRFTHNYFFMEKNPTIVNFPIKGLDMQEYIHPYHLEKTKSTLYDLIANISLSQEPGSSTKTAYSVYLLHKPTGKWFQIRDLQVTEVMPPMITLSESYIQIWEQQKSKAPV